jgi:hypothetical protein
MSATPHFANFLVFGSLCSHVRRNRSDVAALFAMAAFFFSLGLFAILRLAALRNAMDNFANAWKRVNVTRQQIRRTENPLPKVFW